MCKGRRKKSEELQQKSKITVWLTKGEKDRLTERAGQLPVSQYFRETLLRGRPPKQPPIVPAVNWQAYTELSEHLQVLRQLSSQFEAHTMNEQAQALARGAQRIREALEAYRMSLIDLQHGGKDDDKQD